MMDADPIAPDRHRTYCRLHAAKRAVERDIPLGMDDLARMETMIARMGPAFERPARNRTWISVLHQGKHRVQVLYDAALGCIVTVWRGSRKPRPGRGPA